MNIGSRKDWIQLLEKANEGDTEAMNLASYYLEEGLLKKGLVIVKMDKKAAFNWTKKSCENGNIDGMIEYANQIIEEGNEFCEQDIPFAMEIYKKAMDKGSAIAAHNLALEYSKQQKFEKAFEHYLKANELGEPEDLNLGQCYYYGIGTAKDKMKAFEILQKSDPSNCTAFENNEINYLLGKIYLEGELIKQNLRKARFHLELANEDQDHRSALALLWLIGKRN